MSQPRKSFKTAKNLELPLLSLKGKEYLQIMHRIQWFRSEQPTGVIKTSMLALAGEGANEYAVFKAEVFIETDKGAMMIATGHKKETRGGFDDFIEKAETGAVGRALALCGYGTQFASDDLDEGNRLADSPAPVLDKNTPVQQLVNTSTVVGNGSGGRASFRKSSGVQSSGGGAVVASSSGDDI